MRFSLDSLPPALRRQAEAALAQTAKPADCRPSYPTPNSLPSKPPSHGENSPSKPLAVSPSKPTTRQNPSKTPSAASGHSNAPNRPSRVSLAPYRPQSIAKPPYRDSRGTPNRTEERYNRQVLCGAGRYEPITFRMPGGNYTPDWMTMDDGVPTFHEVKGAYRFASQSRAVLGFKSAAAAFPFFNFVWATLGKGGTWDVRKAESVSDPEDHEEEATPTPHFTPTPPSQNPVLSVFGAGPDSERV